MRDFSLTPVSHIKIRTRQPKRNRIIRHKTIDNKESIKLRTDVFLHLQRNLKPIDISSISILEVEDQRPHVMILFMDGSTLRL